MDILSNLITMFGLPTLCVLSVVFIGIIYGVISICLHVPMKSDISFGFVVTLIFSPTVFLLYYSDLYNTSPMWMIVVETLITLVCMYIFLLVLLKRRY